ncbi:protein phosphatase 2C [Tieghemostelium lacteum]|uniref:Protein phosphatase 2C n=1 Tax=Tieghemostelium lacteum TaxID=361077 RepID=A0A151Z914_TIELA|nr:protein phosphatase 2C [Tieghemostelium lacteum]|eukprot:KYQ90440.1 protein phosphatase 2C [Tieghemostelium lacteum]
MISNEFIEFIFNLYYTSLSLIVISFFYQNQHYLFTSSTSSGGSTTSSPSSPSPLQSPNTLSPNTLSPTTGVNSSPLSGVSSPISLNIVDKDEQIRQLQDQIDKQRRDINQYYEKNKEEKLKTFNEKNVLTLEVKELRDKEKKLESENQQLKESLNTQKHKISDLTKDRDHIYASEHKLLGKVADFEKRERSLVELDKVSKQKITEQKDTIKTLKREIEDLKKKLKKSETQLDKLHSSSSPSSSSNSVLVSTTTTNSNSSFQTTTTQPVSIPNSQSSDSLSSVATSPSSDDDFAQLSNSPSNSSSSSTFSSTSTLGGGDSTTPKQIKSFIKNIKNDIFQKAQKSINKRLGPDFFAPPISSSPTKDIQSVVVNNNSNNTTPSNSQIVSSNSQLTQATLSATTTTSTSTNVITSSSSVTSMTTLKFDNLLSDELSQASTDEIKTEKSPRPPPLPMDLSTYSLGDLLIQSDIDLSSRLSELKVDSIDNNNNSNNIRSSADIEDQPCILNFAIKESENKVGLKRAKKKPLPGQTDMMEDVSFAKSPYNESKDIGLFGVFDGHAGKGAAESASKLFPVHVGNLIGKSLDSKDQGDLFVQCFSSVDNAMKSHEYEGCTATVAIVWKCSADQQRYLQVANLGDSSAYLCRGGRAIELTFDHKANDPREKQRLIDAGIPVTENQSRINGIAVSRSLGNHFVKDQNIGMIADPHVSQSMKIQPDDQFLILASDGLWDTISGQDACDLAQSKYPNGSTEMASLLLAAGVNSPLCKDNVTVLVIKLN